MNAPYAKFGDYLTAAAAQQSLSDPDVAANLSDSLGKTDDGALSWWRRLRMGFRREALSEAQKRALADVLALDLEELRREAERAGL